MAQPAEFRRLKGVGPAAEARLHHAGVGTWADLAQVLTVLAKAAGRYESLADLAGAVAEQADRERSVPHRPDPETAAEPTEAPTGATAEPTAEPTAGPRTDPARAFAVDAGLAIGGAPRDVVVQLEPLPTGPGPRSYRAELVGRLLGASGTDTWQPLGARQLPAGGDGGQPATVRFDAVPVPDGIHRLMVRLTAQAT